MTDEEFKAMTQRHQAQLGKLPRNEEDKARVALSICIRAIKNLKHEHACLVLQMAVEANDGAAP